MAHFSPEGYKTPSTETELNDFGKDGFWESAGLNQDARFRELDAGHAGASADAAKALQTANSYAGQIAQANTTAGSAVTIARGAEDTADNAASRVDALEVMGGVQPGSVNDAEMALHTQQQGGLFNAALNAQTVQALEHGGVARPTLSAAVVEGIVTEGDPVHEQLKTTTSEFVDEIVPPMVPPLVADAIADDRAVADAAAAAASSAVQDYMGTIGDAYLRRGVINTENLNDYFSTSQVGVYSVTANALNRPAGTTLGALEIIPITGGALQRFTDIYTGKSWHRRSAASPWIRQALASELPDVAALDWRKGVIGTGDLDDYFTLNQSGTYFVGSTVANRPAGASIGTLELLPMQNGNLQRYVDYLTGDMYIRRAASAPWNKVAMMTDIPEQSPRGSGSGFKVVPLAVTTGRSHANAATAGTVRYPIHFNAPITRWRIHLRNSNPLTGNARTGAVTVNGFWLGEHAGNGAFEAGFKRVVDAFTTPENGDEWVSPWLSADIGGNVERLLSFGYSAPSAPHLNFGGCWTSPSSAEAAHPAPALAQINAGPFEVWIEAETYATTPVVAVYGSSTDAGVGGSMPVLNATVAQYARANRALPYIQAHSGASMLSTENGNAYMWQRWAHLDGADTVLLAMGSNDVYGGADLATLKNRHAHAVELARQFIAPTVYGSNVFKRPNGEATGDRTGYNAWLATQPNGIRDVFDFSAVIGEAPPAEWDADGVHLTDLGLQQLLNAISRPISAPAPLYPQSAT